MFAETATGILTAAEVWDKRAALVKMLRSLRLLLPGVPHTAVFGAGGTGKSTLGRFIEGELDTDSEVGPYAETRGVDEVTTARGTLNVVRIAPGQKRRWAGNWDELFKEISAGRAVRIINVVSWGYHATELDKKTLRVFRDGISDEELRHAYFESNRTDELEALRFIVPHLQATSHPIRLLTLVTKQDLWWQHRYDVKEHYVNGQYAKIVEEIRAHKGTANFSHEIVSGALVQQNLKTADDYLLAATAAGYDDPLRVANMERVANALQHLLT